MQLDGGDVEATGERTGCHVDELHAPVRDHDEAAEHHALADEQVVVALDSASRVRDGDDTTLWFDSGKMMIFDPESGVNLTRDDAEATRIDAENEEDRKTSLARSKEREEREVRAAG